MEASVNVRQAASVREAPTAVKAPTMGIGKRPASSTRESSPAEGEFAADLRVAMSRTQQWLLGQQQPDGHWVAELEGDTILESEYICVLAYLGRHRTPTARKAAEYILSKQLPSGGWTLYPGGGMDISGSVKAYFSLKLTGHDPDAEYMHRARAAIRAAGGADAVNSFTRFYLALLGQISYDECPAVPARGNAPAALVPDQLVFGQRLDADHVGSAVGDVGLSNRSPNSTKSWASPSCS